MKKSKTLTNFAEYFVIFHSECHEEKILLVRFAVIPLKLIQALKRRRESPSNSAGT